MRSDEEIHSFLISFTFQLQESHNLQFYQEVSEDTEKTF